MRLTFVGLVLGLGGAFAVNSLLASALVDVSGAEIGPMLIAAAVLALVAAAACYVPARRATRIDPATVLRND
jgi:ABC-type antimicrobial peptide transport system permease subunit